MKATLNLSTTSLETNDGMIIATARKTPRGWYWFSNIGRVGRRDDFPNKEAALRAAAKSIGLEVCEVIAENQP